VLSTFLVHITLTELHSLLDSVSLNFQRNITLIILFYRHRCKVLSCPYVCIYLCPILMTLNSVISMKHGIDTLLVKTIPHVDCVIV
jgi:hypothetical protein